MLENNKDSNFKSAMFSSSILTPSKDKKRLSINPTLLLTSLIDVFAILVIYLLVSTSDPSLNVESELLGNLPQAEDFTQLMDGFVITIENGRFYIEDKPVSMTTIRRELEELFAAENKKASLVIVSSKESQFNSISPLVRAASEAGVENIKFAILPKRGS